MADNNNSNLSLLEKVDIRNLDACAELFSDDFVWHYFNPKLPELEGDYRGVQELKDFFAKLFQMSKGGFNVNVVDARCVGDELVVTQTCNRISFEGNTIEFDVVVVWRIVEGKIREAWDIPSVFNVRNIDQSQS